jgi:small subunit ribosomal protein S6
MFLLDSSRYATDHEAAVNEIHEVLKRVDATIVAERPWADGRLAYPINGHRKGLHYLVYFNMDSNSMDELNRLCRLQTNFIRSMFILPPHQLFDLMAQALLNPEAIQQMQQDDEPVRRRGRAEVETDETDDEEVDVDYADV